MVAFLLKRTLLYSLWFASSDRLQCLEEVGDEGLKEVGACVDDVLSFRTPVLELLLLENDLSHDSCAIHDADFARSLGLFLETPSTSKDDCDKAPLEN
jgi:hypothetical protein